jgi:hypothetical protein
MIRSWKAIDWAFQGTMVLSFLWTTGAAIGTSDPQLRSLSLLWMGISLAAACIWHAHPTKEAEPAVDPDDATAAWERSWDEQFDHGPGTWGDADLDEARTTLGIGPEADELTARAAYRRAALLAHPDRGGDHEKFLQIQSAWERVRGAYR